MLMVGADGGFDKRGLEPRQALKENIHKVAL